jgi:hypothetical protein
MTHVHKGNRSISVVVDSSLELGAVFFAARKKIAQSLPPLRSEISQRFRDDREANLFHGLAPGHHSTGEWSRLSALTIKEVASLKSFTVAPDQYPVVHVPVSQLPPSVIHSPVRNTSQTQIAFLGSDGSTVQRLLRHHVQGVPLEHRSTFLPCLNCSSENAEYTVRIPLASVLGSIVLHGTEDMLAPSCTAQKQIALVGSSGCGMHKADVQRAY